MEEEPAVEILNELEVSEETFQKAKQKRRTIGMMTR